VINSENAKPNSNWLDYTTTGKAKSKIKSSLREENKKIAEDGKQILARKLKSLKITLDEKTINQLVNFFKLKTSQDLFYRAGNGIIDNQQLRNFASSRNNAFLGFFKNRMRKQPKPEDVQNDEITVKYDQLVFGKEEEKLDYTLANCCNPIPGDEVFGFITVNDGIKVHKNTCPNALQLQSNYTYRIIQAKWIDSSQQDFRAQLKITGIDNLGLVNSVTKVISNHMNIDIKSLSFESDDGVFTGKIIVIVKNKNILTEVINKIKKINGIDKVTRV
ncbi:ACT domain-containing protein, partial [uncultured Planktosalinus sp.]|uniref:ACT domain-containing protein n=1 Tax=uncultured Planktosalinus sp. TaxID=1810935 RepID=UPI0030DA8670